MPALRNFDGGGERYIGYCGAIAPAPAIKCTAGGARSTTTARGADAFTAARAGQAKRAAR